jgi:hypothetical protein
VRTDGRIWGRYDTRRYLEPLDRFLGAEYERVADGIYISPALYARCLEKE